MCTTAVIEKKQDEDEQMETDEISSLDLLSARASSKAIVVGQKEQRRTKATADIWSKKIKSLKRKKRLIEKELAQLKIQRKEESVVVAKGAMKKEEEKVKKQQQHEQTRK